MNPKAILSPISFLIPLFCLWLCGCATTPPAPQWKPLDASSLTQPLSLDQCLQLARENDIRAVQWKARFDAAHAELISAKALPNPTFNPAWDDMGIRDDTGRSLGNLTYGVSYPLFFWWPRAQKIAAAKANQQVEMETVRSEQRKLAVEMAAAYFALVADQRKVKLLENVLQIAEEAMRLVQKKRELKIASDYDVERVRTEQLQAESDLAEARSQLRQDQLVFAFALGADRPFFPYVLDCGDVYTEYMKEEILSETIPDRLMDTALQTNPDWAEKKAAVKAAKAQLQVEHRLAIPLTESVVSGGPKKDPEGWARAYSLDIPIPLFNWNRGAIRKAEAELKTAQAEEEMMRRAAVTEVSQAWEKYHATSMQWNRYTQTIAQLSMRNEQAAFKLFAAGQIDYDELLKAQRDNKQTQLSELAVWRDTSISAWVLSCILGQHES